MKQIIFVLLFFISFDVYSDESKNIEFNKKLIYYGLPAIGFSFLFDDNIKEIVQSNRSDFQDRIWENITYLGSPYILALGILGYSYAYLDKNKKLMYASIYAVQSATISAFIVLPIKYLTGRERPSKEDKYSFPSAHTAIAFSFWGSFAEVYDNGVYPYVFYFIPVAVAYSRIYLNKHWLSDVVAGAVIGIGSKNIAKKISEYLYIRYRMSIFIDISSKKAGITYIF